MPAHKRTDAPQKILITIPGSLRAQLDLLHLDPLSNKPRYGEMSNYITKLIRDDLTKRGIKV